MANRWNISIQRYIRTHAHLYVFTTVLFVVGIVFGSVVVAILDDVQRHSLLLQLQNFVTALNGNHVAPPATVTWDRIASNIKLIGIIWILGLSIIGLPVIIIILFLKGFVVGFTVGFLVEQWATKGLLFAIAAVLPQNILLIPAFVFASVAGIAFSLKLVQSRFYQRGGSLYHHFLSYSGLTLLVAVVIVVAAFIEGYVSPIIMHWITPHL